MPRPRKPLAAQTGHLTKETQETRKYEESLVNAGKDELENIPAALFLDAVAKKEYKRPLFAIMNQAKKEMETAGKVLGMSPTARLQAASSKTKVQAEELEGMFGDI